MFVMDIAVKAPKKKTTLFLLSGLLLLFVSTVKLPIFGSTFVMYAGELVLLAPIVFFVFKVALTGRLYADKISLLLLLIAFVGLLGLYNADDYSRFTIGFTNYVEAALIMLAITNVKFTENQLTRISKAFIFSGVILAFRIIYKTYAVNHGDFLVGDKITLDLGGSNYLASILLLPYFILLTTVFKTKFSRHTFPLLLGLASVGVATIYSGSRAALIIMMILTAAFVSKDIIFSKQKAVGKFLNILMISIGLFVIYRYSINFIEQMIELGRFDNFSSQDNVVARLDIFKNYWNAFLSHPMYGNGFMNVKAFGIYYLAHNSFLQILADAGMIAAALFLILVIQCFKTLKTTIGSLEDDYFKNFVLGFRRGFIAVFIHGMAEPNFGTKLFMIYVFIGIAIIVCIKRSDKNQIAETSKK